MTLNLTVCSRLTLLTGLTALLAACGTGTTKMPKPTPAPTEVAGLIPGQITPFTAGDASSVHEGDGTTAGSLVDASGNLLTALVSDQGVFNMALPKAATMTASPDASLLFNFPDVFGVCNNPSSTPTPAPKVYPINFLTTDTAKRIVSEIDPSKANLNYRTWWFSATTVTVHFKGTGCIGLGDIDTTFALKRGWNLIIQDTNPGVSTTYTASTQPTTAVPWQYASTTMGAAALKYPNLLTPWKNLPQYKNR